MASTKLSLEDIYVFHMNEDDHQFEKYQEDDFCKLIPLEEIMVEEV